MPETKLDADVELLIHGASFPIVNPLGIDINTLNNWKSGTTKPRPAKVRDTAVTLCNAIKNRADDQESLLKKARIIATKYCPDELSDLNNLGNFPAFIFRLAENREKLQEEKPVEQKPAKKKSSKRIISSKRHKEKGSRTSSKKPGTDESIPEGGDGYSLLPVHYEQVQMYRERWDAKASIRKLIMLHLNGGVFRVQRLKWQVEVANKHLPKDFRWPDKVFDENPVDRDRRLEIELEGAEPWPKDLQNLCVFIGTESSFKRWVMPEDKGVIENPRATRAFWVQYLRKLKNSYDRLRHTEGPSFQFHAELYEVDIHDFYAHVFNYDEPGGYIVGSHLWSGRNALRAFEIKWPKNKPEPVGYSNLKARIEKMRTDKSVCRKIPLT